VGDDQKDLEGIVARIESLLARLVNEWSNLMPAQLHHVVGEAWPDVHKQLQNVRYRISHGADENVLRERGLTGTNLALKKSIFDWLWGSGIGNSLRRDWFRKVLRYANSLLGSIPGAEIAKEFKEALEEAIDA
jgi:hypothetical protein